MAQDERDQHTAPEQPDLRPVRYVPGWARDQELDPDDDLLRLAHAVGVERQRRHYARPDAPFFVTSVRPDPDLVPAEREPATASLDDVLSELDATDLRTIAAGLQRIAQVVEQIRGGSGE